LSQPPDKFYLFTVFAFVALALS